MRGKGRNSFFTSRSFVSRSWQKRRKTNQGELKKMSLSPEEIEDGEDETSEDKDNGSRDEVPVWGSSPLVFYSNAESWDTTDTLSHLNSR